MPTASFLFFNFSPIIYTSSYSVIVSIHLPPSTKGVLMLVRKRFTVTQVPTSTICHVSSGYHGFVVAILFHLGNQVIILLNTANNNSSHLLSAYCISSSFLSHIPCNYFRRSIQYFYVVVAVASPYILNIRAVGPPSDAARLLSKQKSRGSSLSTSNFL